MKTPAGRRTNKYFVASFGFLVIAALAALPSVQSRRLARTSIANPGHHSSEVPESKAATSLGRWNWMPNVAAPTVGGETIEIFAADCTTAKTAFALGETICAKTNGVDLTVPGNYYVNWFHPDSTETNGGTITQNPQYFLFSLPTGSSEAGTWRANIGRVAPAESSIIGNPPLFTVSAAPTIATFAYALGACTNTPKTNFVVGETVCARTVGVDPQFNRRFAWVDADGITREFTPITTDPATDDYPLLLTETSIGTWKANVVSSRSTTVVGTPFTVAALIPSVDLSIGKALASAELKSGEDATFTISVYSRGPNDAENVVITDVTPNNAMFVSATQTEGSGFSCTGTTTVTCTGAVLIPGERAVFEFVYTPGAAGQTITNTATVESDTPEVVAGEDTDGDTIDDASEDNSATAGPYTISPGNGGGGDTCTVACPDDIQTPANTTDGGGNPGALVHFSPPSGNDECGTITVDHCNDCFFPQGDTVVTATASTGETCSFTVRITPAGSHPTISCPGNKTGNADGSCSATFNLGTATASGQNVTVVAYRSDGKPVYTCDVFGNCTRNGSDAPFSVGVTTVTWYAYAHDVPGPYTGPVDGNGDPINPADTEEGHRNGSATCTQTVTVNDVTPPTIAATNQTIAADASCQAAVPDYSNTVSDNCACSSSDNSEDCQNHNDIVYSQNPAAGTMLPPGTYTVHIEANDGTNNATKDITLTVADQTPPTITCPANITTNTEPGVCSAHVNPGTATATDNCDSSPTVVGTRSDNQPLSATYPKGTTTITWTATDASGNHSSCAQTVTVNDHENPSISCPANITTGTDPNSCSATVNPGSPTASDNCGSPTVTGARSDGQALNSPYPKGTTTITWTATDSSGNHSSCNQTITVNDTQPPVITCQANIIADFDPAVNGATVTYTTPVGTDNCPGANTIRTAGPASGSVFPLGTTTVTFQVTDGAGLTAMCSFKVTVALTSIIGLDSITMTGSGYVDSYSSAGGYPATKGSLANLLSNGTITMGNSAKVWGNVRSTRAGINMTGASQITGNATAGTTVTTSGSASVGGTRTNNSPGPVMTLPAVPACGPPYSSAAGITGTYSYNAGTGDLTLSGVNIATLANGNYCFHNVTLGNSSQLKVNGLVVIKMTGTLKTSGASSLNNTTQIPGNLRILSSYSGSNGVVLGNSTNVYSVIYAPNTGLNISGAVPLFGTADAKTLTIGNSGAIHYDTQLKSIWPNIWTLILGP